MIVFPMAGLSSRFARAGYTVPKYMLPLAGGTCFDFAVMGFTAAFAPADFVFVVRDVGGTPDFVRDRLASLGLSGARVVVLNGETAGQAETVERALGAASDDALTVFNIDTFRPGFALPPRAATGHGYLETFVGPGDGWSFVEDDGSGRGRVARTTEKVRISDLCCTGLYHFATADLFRQALARERASPSAPELYVAPIYNHLIADGCDIRYTVVPAGDVVFCGVPAEYEALLRDPERLARRFDGARPPAA